MSGGFGPLLKGAAGVLPSLTPVLGKLAKGAIKKIESGVLALGRSGYRKHNIFFIWPNDCRLLNQSGLSAKSKGVLFLTGPFNSLRASLKLTYISHFQ